MYFSEKRIEQEGRRAGDEAGLAMQMLMSLHTSSNVCRQPP